MKKVLKWMAIVLGALVGLALAAALALYLLGAARYAKVYTFNDDKVTLPTDAASLARGKHLADLVCSGCHGKDFSGVEKWFYSDALGRIDSANLTAGEGGKGKTYSDADFVRAMRHGVNQQGQAIFMVAVPALSKLSNSDLGSIIAYLRSVPPVNHTIQPRQFSVMAYILFELGAFGKLPVEAVDHNTNPAMPPIGVTGEYGEYLVNISDCRTCHGAELSGGVYPDPTIKAKVPNLTPGGELLVWSAQDFTTAMRSGVKPGGVKMDPELMPWTQYGAEMSDDELSAIYIYLKSLPKLATK